MLIVVVVDATAAAATTLMMAESPRFWTSSFTQMFMLFLWPNAVSYLRTLGKRPEFAVHLSGPNFYHAISTMQ